MPAMMKAAPRICGQPTVSLNSQTDRISTETISRYDAANAGPMGACLSSVIQLKNEPM
ncbi:hypothetical protein D3C85_1814710 [compost metagenome]